MPQTHIEYAGREVPVEFDVTENGAIIWQIADPGTPLCGLIGGPCDPTTAEPLVQRSAIQGVLTLARPAPSQTDEAS